MDPEGIHKEDDGEYYFPGATSKMIGQRPLIMKCSPEHAVVCEVLPRQSLVDWVATSDRG